MERKDLLEKIETVLPAVAGNALIPIMNSFWFTGSSVLAYNDQIAISVPLKTEFKGAVPKSLLDLLKNSRAKEIEFEPTQDALKVKAASSRITLGLQPASDFIFEMPKPSGKPIFEGKGLKAFCSAVRFCLRSIGHNVSVPDELGVTLIPDGNDIALYSTDDATMSRSVVKSLTALKSRIVLSAEFCDQMVKMISNGSGADSALFLADDHCIFQMGSIKLFGKLISADQPIDYEGRFGYAFPESATKKLIPVPSKMQLVIERASIIADSKMEPAKTSITIRDGKMTFSTKASDRGAIVDTVQIEGNQSEVAISVDPRYLKRGYDGAEKMLVTARSVAMSQGSSVLLIAVGE